MKRHMTIGPERVEATFGVLSGYLEELKAHGVPDTAKTSFTTAADGETVLVVIDFDEEVEAAPVASNRHAHP